MQNKLRISLSFDDGRKDTYDYAYKIMKKYNLVGTIHIISGYIDGTWEEKGMDSSYGACGIEDLKEMKDYGIEISLHGDKHTTNKEDLDKCIKKAQKWSLIKDKYGFSVPFSNEKMLNSKEFRNFTKSKIYYIRVGKNIHKLSFIKKANYLLYDITRLFVFYKWYNIINTNNLDNYDKMHLISIPVKRTDKEKHLERFISKNINKNKWLIFLFHSIVPKNSEYYGKDKWTWAVDSFESFCKYLNKSQKNNIIKIDTIINIVGEHNV